MVTVALGKRTQHRHITHSLSEREEEEEEEGEDGFDGVTFQVSSRVTFRMLLGRWVQKHFSRLFWLLAVVAVVVVVQIILGSSSMPRQHILAEMGYDFTVMTADIDEKAIRKDKPEELVTALAEAKHFRQLSTTALEDSGSVHADAILSSLQNVDSFVEDVHTTLLITADTLALTRLIDLEVVVHEGRIREKPSSKDEARNFIEGLLDTTSPHITFRKKKFSWILIVVYFPGYSGGRAEVVGSVLVTNLKTGRREAGWERAEVYFYDIPAQVVQSLIDEGITLNVAGGLMLEHPLTLPFVKEVIGTDDTVMGLPKSLTERLIQEALT
ncbi:hypothetical protein EUGRSUZ_I02441 [Eucalyptus grandis]|uniref:Uncharacterized protein n=2 Tax=Eucalyptus grandis TaxID=71139 RepID=A0ACC3JIN5_EUCGR|nr:hypothetical protein EUGRSUZ_I02441 [Eucalyptus grandis]